LGILLIDLINQFIVGRRVRYMAIINMMEFRILHQSLMILWEIIKLLKVILGEIYKIYNFNKLRHKKYILMMLIKRKPLFIEIGSLIKKLIILIKFMNKLVVC
jgi:hypothetical protein